MQADEVIVLRLGRYFQTVEGWLKHHGSIHWEVPVRIPTGWSAGEDTNYEGMAAAVHHGEEHEAEHYTAFLFHEGQAWHVDDHRPAERVMHVEAEDIYLIWLRKMSQEAGSQMDEDDVRKEDSADLTDFHHWFSSCNITQWSRGVLDWFYHATEEAGTRTSPQGM